MSLFDTEAFSSRLFFPRPDRSPPPAGATDTMVAVDGAQLHVRTHAAREGARTLVLFHGNGEVVADYDDAAADFAAAGARLVVMDYRGYGRSTGTPSLRTAIADAHAVIAAVPGPVIVMGRSLGSACAAELYAANLPAITGVILESGSTDLAALVRRRGITPPAQLDAADEVAFAALPKIARGTAPLLVLHGANDAMISAREAEAAFAAATTPDKRIVLVPDRGHNDVSLSPVYWSALAAFVSA